MKGFMTYQWLSFIRSFKWIPPLVVFVTWIVVLYAYRGLPILSSYAVSSIVLYLTITWLTLGLFTIDDPAEKHMLFVQLKSKFKYVIGKWAIGAAFVILFTFLAILYPLIMGNFVDAISPSQLALAIYAHVSLGIFGMLLGTWFTATMLAPQRYAWLLVVLVLVATIAYEGIIQTVDFLKWILLILPPVILNLSLLQDEPVSTLGKSIAVIGMGTGIYMLLSVWLIRILFLKKER